jgi:hypothetical protein
MQHVSENLWFPVNLLLMTVVARSKALNVFVRSNAGIVGSNPIQGVDVCVYSVFVMSCMWVAATRRAHPPSKESYRLCIGLRN